MGRSAKIRHRRRRRDLARSEKIRTIDEAIDRTLRELAATARGPRVPQPGTRAEVPPPKAQRPTPFSPDP